MRVVREISADIHKPFGDRCTPVALTTRWTEKEGYCSIGSLVQVLKLRPEILRRTYQKTAALLHKKSAAWYHF